MLYFTLFEGSSTAHPNSSTGQGLYSYSLSSSNTAGPGTFTPIYQQNTGNLVQLDAITIDTVTGKYYGVDSAIGGGGVYVGSLTAPGVAPTLDADFSATLPASGSTGATDVVVDDVAVSTGSTTVTDREGGPAVVVNNGSGGNSISVTDDGTPITSATVRITNFQLGDTLGVQAVTGNQINGTNITESYNSATGELTLTGIDTVAHYQTALNEVTFTTTAASVTPRTISFSATDGLASGSGSDTVDILGQPAIGGTSGVSAKFYQNSGAPQILDNTITVSDPNGASITSALVTIDSAGELGTDRLSFNGSNSQTFADNATITATYSNGFLNLLTTAGTASVADYQMALREVNYTSTGDPTNGGADRSRTISWSVSDADFVTSASATTSLSVFARPAVVIGANSPTPTTSGTAVTADPGLAITDSNASPFTGSISSATVQITGGFQTGDTLSDAGVSDGSLVPNTSIHATYNSATQTLTLSGGDTLADYQKALDEAQFNATSPNGGTRTLTWVVNDEAGGNTNDSVAVTSAVNAAFPPVVTAGATATFTGGGNAVTLDFSLTLADATNPTLASATVTDANFITGDVLNFTNTNTTDGNIVGSYANGVLTLTSAGNTATLAQWQTALESVTYSFSPSNGDPANGGGDTSRTIDWQITDTTPQSSTVVTSTLDTVHAAPTVTAGNSTIFVAGGTAVATDINLTVNDPDSGDNLTGATITISSGLASGDVLNFTALGNITGTYSNGVLTLTGTATIAQYQAALEFVTYLSTARSDQWRRRHQPDHQLDRHRRQHQPGHQRCGVFHHFDRYRTAITAGAIRTYVGGSAPVTLDPTIAITDSFGSLSGATVTISGLAGDTLMINGNTSGTSERSATHSRVGP